MKELPQFIPMDTEFVDSFVRDILHDPQSQDADFVVALLFQKGNAFRVIFDVAYFSKGDAAPNPTRSQWNTLKKKFKRRHQHVFVFKEHGTTADGNYFLDFGFMAPR